MLYVIMCVNQPLHLLYCLSVVNVICHHVCIPDTTSTLSLSVVNVICHYEKLNQAMHLLTVLLELGKLDYLEL